MAPLPNGGVPLPNGGMPVSPYPVVPGPGFHGGLMGEPTSDGCMSDGCGGACCPGPCCDGCCCDGCCCDGCCCDGWDGCCGCGPFANRWFGSAEYLLWFLRGSPTPPLVTTGSVFDNPPGAIGQPGTAILAGNSTALSRAFSGFRGRLGYWFGCDHCFGIEGGGFFLGTQQSTFSASSSGLPFLGRPIFSPTGRAGVEEVASPPIPGLAAIPALFFPGTNGIPGSSGMVSVVNKASLWGAEANLRTNFLCGCNWYCDCICGWRILGLNESLTVNENLLITNSGINVTNPLPVGTTIAVQDRFRTFNLFNGGQWGFDSLCQWGRWSLGLRTTVALGVTQRTVDIFGATQTTVPGGAPQSFSGGILALSSNMGRHVNNTFSVVPEVGVNLGYQCTNHIRCFVGYNFLYWSNVARPGNQIDLGINPNLVPPVTTTAGPARPAFLFHGSDFWAQGVNFGLEFRY
jgi:hypothetical protein